MYKVKKSKDGTVTLSCSGATHELLYWHTYTLTPEAGERLAAALREEGCRGSLQKMTEQAGFGITVYVSYYFRQHDIPYSYTGGSKDDEGDEEYESAQWP